MIHGIPPPRTKTSVVGHEARRRSGYALLMTVILLALAASTMATVARRSYATVLDASRAERRIQREWLVYSVGQLLPGADALMPEAREGDLTPRGRRDMTIHLGSQQVALRIADEQSKVNLNTLWNGTEPQRFTAGLQELGRRGRDGGRIAAPAAMTDFHRRARELETSLPSFMSFEQIWDEAGVRAMMFGDIEVVGVLDRVTLWGNGRIRADRADLEALQGFLHPLLTRRQIDQLAAYFTPLTSADDAPPSADIEQLAEVLDLTDRQQRILPERLTDASECFSARITINDGMRSWPILLVHEPEGRGGVGMTLRFDW